MKFRKKPIVIEATQWLKNGDHPEDGAYEMFDYPHENGGVYTRPKVIREGKVVRYFRRPDVPGDSVCPYCPFKMDSHGWIDTVQGGHTVCPGDWIITDDRVADPRGHGHYYPCKPDIFTATYEAIGAATA